MNDTDTEIWGNKIFFKNNDVIRLSFQNINGFLAGEEGFKAEKIQGYMEENQVDVFCLAETNTNWRLISKTNSLEEKVRGWFKNKKVITTYNEHDRFCRDHQPGGTAIISRDEMALRHIRNGHDPKRLGRWCWKLFRGKKGLKLRVVSVYFATVNKEHGKKKAYMQQKLALLKMKKTESVFESFCLDFWKEVDKWLSNGEQLVICGDWNIDVRKERFLEEFQKRNLIPAITHKHRDQGPETYNRGRYPIDEIFVSPTLQVQQCGYQEHGTAAGDHRPIWVDITKVSAVGAPMSEVVPHKARRLKGNDPRVVHRYNQILEKYLKKNKVFTRLERLYNKFTVPLTKAQIDEIEELDKIRSLGMIMAEKGCRKLRMGKVHWSPELQKARDKITYLKLSLSRWAGCKIGAKLLMRLARSLGVNCKKWEDKKLHEALDEANKAYRAIKKDHRKLRETYLDDLASALERSGKGKKASNIKKLKTVEQQREMYQKLRTITKSAQHLGTTFVKP